MAPVDYSLYTTTITSGSYPTVKVKTRKRIVQVLVRFRQSVIVLVAAVFPVQACKATDNRFRALAPLASWVPDPDPGAIQQPKTTMGNPARISIRATRQQR